MNCLRSTCVLRSILGLLLLFGCAEPTSQTGDAGWPQGALLLGSRAAVSTLLQRAESLEGTPLAEAASALRTRLPDCALLEAHEPEGDPASLLAALRCHTPGGALAAVAAERAESDLVFAVPVRDAGRAVGRVRVEPARVTLDLEWMPTPDVGALALLLPGAEGAGPAHLAPGDALVRMRVRPGTGIDLTPLVAADSQAQQLFQLRSALFTHAVLEGAWEIAAYLPPEGAEMPRVAIAFDVRSRAVAVGAANAFLAELARTWDVRVQDFSLDAKRTGACLADLRLMPDLAPCYVTTDAALVVGWNADSLAHALGGTPAATPDDPGRLEIDLALFREADALLSRHLTGSESLSGLRWPWRRAVARAHRKPRGPVRLRVELEGALDT